MKRITRDSTRLFKFLQDQSNKYWSNVSRNNKISLKLFKLKFTTFERDTVDLDGVKFRINRIKFRIRL